MECWECNRLRGKAGELGRLNWTTLQQGGVTVIFRIIWACNVQGEMWYTPKQGAMSEALNSLMLSCGESSISFGLFRLLLSWPMHSSWHIMLYYPKSEAVYFPFFSKKLWVPPSIFNLLGQRQEYWQKPVSVLCTKWGLISEIVLEWSVKLPELFWVSITFYFRVISCKINVCFFKNVILNWEVWTFSTRLWICITAVSKGFVKVFF